MLPVPFSCCLPHQQPHPLIKTRTHAHIHAHRHIPEEEQAPNGVKEQTYDGRNYVAAEGLFWDLPSGAMRVAATQLQHRVPCWGYVLQVCVFCCVCVCVFVCVCNDLVCGWGYALLVCFLCVFNGHV